MRAWDKQGTAWSPLGFGLLKGMAGKRGHLGMDPRVERKPADGVVEIGCIVCLPDADVSQAARNPPDTLDDSLSAQFAAAGVLRGGKLGTLFLGHIGRQQDLDLD
jgi:hypothetical protein